MTQPKTLAAPICLASGSTESMLDVRRELSRVRQVQQFDHGGWVVSVENLPFQSRP
jgi:hypothetical protein